MQCYYRVCFPAEVAVVAFVAVAVVAVSLDGSGDKHKPPLPVFKNYCCCCTYHYRLPFAMVVLIAGGGCCLLLSRWLHSLLQ